MFAATFLSISAGIIILLLCFLLCICFACMPTSLFGRIFFGQMWMDIISGIFSLIGEVISSMLSDS